MEIANLMENIRNKKDINTLKLNVRYMMYFQVILL